MKINYLKTIVALTALIFFVGCSENEISSEPQPSEIGVTFWDKVKGEQGAYFEVYKNGSKVKNEEASFVSYGGGQLLNSAYFRQFRISTEYISTMYLRYSFGNKVNTPDSLMYDENGNDLNESTLSLEESKYLSGMVVEMYLPTNDAYQNNGVGNVTLYKMKEIEGVVYHTSGEFKVTFTNNNEEEVTLKGVFWKEKL